MREVRRIICPAACVEVYGLSTPQISAVRFHGGWKPQPLGGAECSWLLVDVNAQASLPGAYTADQWTLTDRVSRPTDASDTLLLFKRVHQPR